MVKKIKLLIVGASNKAARSVAKSLIKHNCEIYILNDVDLAVSKSKYVKHYFHKPAIKYNYDAFKNEIITTVQKLNIDLLLPITDAAIEVILKFKSEISQHCKLIGLNKPEVYKFAHDKHELIKLAEKFNLNTPSYIFIESINDFHKLENISYPVVVKPVSSAKMVGAYIYGFKVAFPNNKEELIDVLRELILSSPVMVQQYIEGYGIGYNVYCINGEVKSEYIHQRLNENSGVSSYRKIIAIDSFNLRQPVHQLLKEIGWNGPAMVEFKVTKEHVPYLMEMNGRFFGSTELGVKAGFDFPLFLFNDQFKNNFTEPTPSIDKTTSYSLRFLHDEIQLKLTELFKTKKLIRFLKWLFSLCNTIRQHNYIEDNIFEDPKFVISLYKHDLKRIASKKTLIKQITAVAINKIEKKELLSNDTIAFVCKGNICRSPFAAEYAKKLLPGKNIISFGTVDVINRLCPVNAINASKEMGIDLSGHTSKHMHNFNLNNSTIFIVMDKLNYIELKELGIAESKIRFLTDQEIKDPYRNSLHFFRATYTEIKEQLHKLI